MRLLTRLPGGTSVKEPICQCRRCKIWSLGQEDPLEESVATHSSILAWRIPWTEEPGRLESIVSQRVESNWSHLAPKHARTRVLMEWCRRLLHHELRDVQPGFRKGRGTSNQIANIGWIIEKAREFQRNIYFCFIDYAKAFDCVDHNKLWKILEEMGL